MNTCVTFAGLRNRALSPPCNLHAFTLPNFNFFLPVDTKDTFLTQL